MEGLSPVTTPSGLLAPLPPVVPASWAAQPLDGLVFADVRWYLDGRSGHDAYLAGHLPGAVWVDVDTALSDPPSPAGGRHPLPSPQDFARRLGRLGIGDDDVVVAYDDAGGCFAVQTTNEQQNLFLLAYTSVPQIAQRGNKLTVRIPPEFTSYTAAFVKYEMTTFGKKLAQRQAISFALA